MKNSLVRTTYYLVLLFIVIYFYYTHFVNSLNFPYFDEYRTISKVIIDFIGSPTLIGKIKVLFVTENESLQLFLKLANISLFYTFGEIRYDLLGLIGQISLLIYPVLIFIINRKKENLLFALGATILIIFNLQYYVLSFRHDTSFYYNLGILGTLTSIYFWIKQKYPTSVLFFLLGIFNNSSSILILFAFFIDFTLSQKRIKLKLLLSITALLSLTLGLFYILNPKIFEINMSPIIMMKSFFIIMGNFVEIFRFHSTTPYLITGVFVLILTIVILSVYYLKRSTRTTSTKFYANSALYFLITLIAIGIKRSNLSIIDLLDPRYKFFTFSLLLFLILLSVEIFRLNKSIKFGLLSFFLFYNLYYSFQSQDYIRFLNQGGKINSMSLKNNYDVLGPTYVDFAPKYYKTMDSLGIAPAVDSGFIEMRNYLQSIDLEAGNFKQISLERENSHIYEHDHDFDLCTLKGYSPSKESYIYLKSEKSVFIFPINYYLRNSKKGFLKTLSYSGDYFYCLIYPSLYPKGEYKVGIITKNRENNNFNVTIENRTLTI